MANNKTSKLTTSFDWAYFMQQCIRRWPWFVASVVVCCALGVVKYKLTPPLAQVNAKVLVSDDSSRGSGGLASMMAKQFDLGNMLGGTGSVYNEMQVMGSHSVFENTVKDLGLNSAYSVKLKWTRPWLNPGEKMPVRLDYDCAIADTLGVALAFALDVNATGQVDYKVTKGWKTLAKGSGKNLPCVISTPYGEFRLSATDYMPKGKSFKEKVLLQSYSAAAEGYEKAIYINTMSKKVDVVGYSLVTDNTEFGRKILTSLIENYNKAGIRQKQEKGVMTGAFLDKRLSQISSELEAKESDMQDYKLEHGLTLVEQDAKLAYTQAKTLRNQLVTAEAELEIMKLVRGFIEDPVNNHSLIPAVGDGFGSAMTAITAYNEVIMERMRLMSNARENNAAIKLIDEQLNAMRGNIKLSLNRGMETYLARMDELKKEVAKAESRLGAVPATEREYVGLERNRAVQEKLYLYLLQQQEENAMRMDASLPRGVVIDQAYVSGEPIGLSLMKMLAVSFMLGLCLPGGYLFVKERLRRTVVSLKEIRSIVDAPVLAEIGNGDSRTEMDALCANVRCMLGADGGKTVMVTSAKADDGKCVLAYQLAQSIARTGEKTLLIEMNFRNPMLAETAKLTGAKGLLQYLTEKQPLSAIVTHQQSGMDVIVSGGIAPNPSMLIASKRLAEFWSNVSAEYECVIVIAPQIAGAGEINAITSLADVNVMVVQSGGTDKDVLKSIFSANSTYRFKNSGIVVTKK